MNYQEIIRFWFVEIDAQQWWVKDEQFDRLVNARFAHIHAQAKRCELYLWRMTPLGRLAEIIILDQFSRNMFRNSPLTFAQDALALVLAQEAISAGADQGLTPLQRSVLYLPFMHSESLLIHELALDLYANNGVESSLEFEIKHKKIIERFGRYPHRNQVLGRDSSAAEIAFLRQPDSGF